MKAQVSTFNQEKALVGAFSVIVKSLRIFVSSSSCLLYLVSSIVSKQVLLEPVSVVVVEGLDVVVVQLLVVVGVGEDGPARQLHFVQILSKRVPHLASVPPELIVVVKSEYKVVIYYSYYFRFEESRYLSSVV